MENNVDCQPLFNNPNLTDLCHYTGRVLFVYDESREDSDLSCSGRRLENRRTLVPPNPIELTYIWIANIENIADIMLCHSHKLCEYLEMAIRERRSGNIQIRG